MGTRVYLAGPIDRCPNRGCSWRDEITPKLESKGVIVLNPLNKPFDTGQETDDYQSKRLTLKENSRFNELSSIMGTIRRIDLKMVRMSDFLIAYIDLNIFSCGTMEEIFTANAENKPVIILCPQGKQKVPDWIFGALINQMFFESPEEVMDYLTYIDEAPYVNTYNRWTFPIFEKIYDKSVLGVTFSGDNV